MPITSHVSCLDDFSSRAGDRLQLVDGRGGCNSQTFRFTSAAQPILRRLAALIDGDNAMTLQEQMRDLLNRHCAYLLDQVETVGQLLSQCCDVGTQSPTPIAKAQNITHQTIGTTGSLGFPDVAPAASALDDNLKLLAAEQHGVSQSQLQVSKQLFERLQ